VGVEAQALVDGRHLLVTPGMVNAHTHSPEALRRGAIDATLLQPWFESVWRRLDALDPEEIALAVQLCAAEMLRSGVTAVVDHFRQSPLSMRTTAAVARAWNETGLRATLALMLRDRAWPAWAAAPAPTTGALLELCTDAARQWHEPSGTLRVALGPSAPTRCSDELLRGCARLAGDAGLHVHMHCDETTEEAALARAMYGRSAVAHLGGLELLGPGVSLAHAVWVDEDDIAHLAASGTAVVHNPVSNLRLGSGRAPLERFLAQGVRVAIGSDGAASNDTQNVREALKTAILLPRIVLREPGEWPTVYDALRMATACPAAAFGLGSGTLAAGEPADFACYDLREPAFSPVNDLHAQFVLAGPGLAARHVVVAGRMVLYEGEILTFDESRTLAGAQALAA
jgi:cytosine/adenosine deaminase-related metal-dependent hydrolase